MAHKEPQEMLSNYNFKTLWATVVKFNKTKRAENIFQSIKMVQNNYEHYANLHSFIASPYRNDYAITLATRIANGNTLTVEDLIPWNLVHIGKNTIVYKNNDDIFNNEYTIMFDNWQRGKIRKEYIIVKDMDFHVMNKENFMELV
jgi:glycine betaine/choline ABC-type transport system substrate-binding protein